MSKRHFEHSKLMPSAVDLEESVLGSIMFDRGALDIILPILKSHHFYKESHQRIYKSIETLYKEKIGVDTLTVVQKLKANTELEIVGGAYYISQLTNKASSPNVEHHARIIQQKFIDRTLIKIGARTENEGYDESIDIFDKIDNLNKGVLEISSIISGKKAISLTELVKTAIEQSKQARSSKVEPAIQTPFYALNKVLGGFEKQALILLGARPGMGKTSKILQCAKYAADNGSPTVVFSLEMPAIGLMFKLLSFITGIPAGRIKRGKLTDMEFVKVEEAKKNINNNLIIHDQAALSVMEIRALTHRYIVDEGVKLVIIDYLQMMKPDEWKKNQEEALGDISRGLKAMAKDFDIPVVALVSLSRQNEARADKRPQLHDLRGSGSLESDADVVMFIYRPDYYDIMQDEKGNDVKGLAEIIISKHREGETGMVKLRFIDHLTKFEDWKKEEDVFLSDPSADDKEDVPF